MRRSASEVIRNLENRIARLERRASKEIDVQYRLGPYGIGYLFEISVLTEDARLAEHIEDMLKTVWDRMYGHPLSFSSIKERKGVYQVNASMKLEEGSNTDEYLRYFKMFWKQSINVMLPHGTSFNFTPVRAIRDINWYPSLEEIPY